MCYTQVTDRYVKAVRSKGAVTYTSRFSLPIRSVFSAIRYVIRNKFKINHPTASLQESIMARWPALSEEYNQAGGSDRTSRLTRYNVGLLTALISSQTSRGR